MTGHSFVFYRSLQENLKHWTDLPQHQTDVMLSYPHRKSFLIERFRILHHSGLAPPPLSYNTDLIILSLNAAAPRSFKFACYVMPSTIFIHQLLQIKLLVSLREHQRQACRWYWFYLYDLHTSTHVDLYMCVHTQMHTLLPKRKSSVELLIITANNNWCLWFWIWQHTPFIWKSRRGAQTGSCLHRALSHSEHCSLQRCHPFCPRGIPFPPA